MWWTLCAIYTNSWDANKHPVAADNAGASTWH